MTESHDNQHSHHFVPPVRYYLGTFIALLILTVITVAIAQVDFGSWNIVVAMGVAVVKATLVSMFFMGLKWDKRINTAFFVASLLFLGIFLGLGVSDVFTRHQTDEIEAGNHNLKSPVKLIKSNNHV
jgi:cytochrome c oxidase subunit 4